MTTNSDAAPSWQLARLLASDLAEFAQPRDAAAVVADSALPPEAGPLEEYDRRIVDDDLRLATRSRFVSTHYADAVEAGVKALNELVRRRSGSALDGDALMTWAFSPSQPRLRLNRLRSDSDRSIQRGHMLMCQAVVAAWRNPRAHSSSVQDLPHEAVMMLEHIQHLMQVTKKATRTRRVGPS